MIVAKPETFENLLNVEVKMNSAVTSINRDKKTVTVNNDYDLHYDKLVLALGASPIIPPIAGIDDERIFTVRTLNDADKIKDFIKNIDVKKAAVIGGGFIGVEMAENMAHLGIETSLIELSDQILAFLDADMVAFAQNQMRENGVNLYLADGVKAFSDSKVILSSGKEVPFDMVILAIGVRPETTIAKEAGLELGQAGSIKVNEFMQTSDADIFAAGDSVEIKDFVTGADSIIPLAGPANRQGRIIADNIAGQNSTYKNTQGTSVVKVFDLTVASVGNNEKRLQKQNIDYKKIHIWGNSHAGYYPNSFPLTIKLLFTNDGEILGAQAVGMEGVEKRIDVISSIMRMKGKVQDLVDSELSYAPPYSSAKDPVNIVGMAADNILKGFVKPAFYEDLKDGYLIDVRKPIQFSTKTIEGAINIAEEELRERLDEIPKDRKVILFCNKGFTSYVASRILNQQGFDNVYSLSGGHLFYRELVKNKEGFLMNNEPKPQIIHNAVSKTVRIDACGMQCPGPIMKLSETMKTLDSGETLELSTTDSGFKSDISAWCDSTGNTLINLTTENKIIKATIQKGEICPLKSNDKNEVKNQQTMIVFSNDLDKALASFIIANGALAAGKDVTMFFTFWGLNVLRKPKGEPAQKGLIDKMFGFMMPKGAEKLILSKMHMGGMGTAMMKWVMKSKNIATLNELIKDAQANGAKIIACNMSMDVMGIKREELIDGVEIAGVAKYINESDKSNSNLFI
jgi:NADPH-dependent 2,4-dienoyl-CoA reductase/sulfur reductase-like enzyme/peroxiredoxin family protein/TusA-related sulfurtransferase/rhodanese-related sulfurtransferase